MNPRRHPQSELLDHFASGVLAQAPSLAIAAHLERCAPCRARLRDREEIEGDRLERLDPTALAPDAMETALARLDSGPKTTVPLSTAASTLDEVNLPKAVADLGLGARRYLSPGLWAAPVRTARTQPWRAFLLRTPGSTVVPTHGHSGGELIVVLEGGFRDVEAYEVGDFVQNIAGQDHQMTAMEGGPCVCLIAIQGRVQWRGWAKVLSPMLGL